MIKLSIPDMSCGHCRASVEQALAPLSGVSAIRFDPEARTAAVDGDATASDLIAALEQIGFPASVATP
jgi:copper chaperone